MPVISKITAQKHNKDRYSIFIESGRGEEYAFSVDEDVLIKYQLKKGMELDDSGISDILFQDNIRKAYNLGIHHLSSRMRSEGEVRSYLKKKEVPELILEEAIRKLYEYNFLDDQAFADAYVRTQMNTSEKGPTVIARELKEKDVPPAVIEQALAGFEAENQLEKAIQLGLKYANKNKKDSTRILRKKLEQLLMRKGYPGSVIQVAMEEILTEKPEDEELEALVYQAERLLRKHSGLSGRELQYKMKQGLYQKGFPLDEIERYLSTIEEE